MTTLRFKEIVIPSPSALNRECFWWSLFVINNLFTYCTSYLLYVLPLNSFLKRSLFLLLIIQFFCLFFWTVKVTTNIFIYQSWRGKHLDETSKRTRAIHTKLDELRESMLFNEEEGKKYWEILVLLDDRVSKIS